MKFKNIAAGFALVTVIGLLIAGGINRTLSKADGSISLFNQDETRNNAHGQNNEVSSPETDQTSELQGRGQGGGRWSQKSGDSQSNILSNDNDGSAMGQADVQEWVSVTGTVTEVDSSYLVITTDDGTPIEVGGRPWSYIQSQDFILEPGSAVALRGFYETEDRFEIGAITNLSTDKDIAIRDQAGRPMWAGGRRDSQALDG